MKKIVIAITVVSCVFAFTTSAVAQQGDTSTIKEDVSSRESPIELVPDEEKTTRTRRALDNMRGALSKVLRYLEEARDQRDVLKMNSLNEKLTAIKGLLRVSEQAYVTMQEALATKDVTVAQHEYEKIMIAARKIEELSAESELTIGALAVYSGVTSVTVQVKDEVISSSALNSSGTPTATTGTSESSSDTSEDDSLQDSIMESPDSAPSGGSAEASSASGDDASSGEDSGGEGGGVETPATEISRNPPASGS